jgi:hypothetical protein
MEGLNLNIQINADINLPDIPSEFTLSNGTKIPVSSLAENALKKIGKAWTDELLKKRG